MSSDFIRSLTDYGGGREHNILWLTVLDDRIRKFKEIMKAAFDTHCETGVYTLKFHLPHHLVENLERFGSLKKLDGSSFKIFYVPFKHAYNHMPH